MVKTKFKKAVSLMLATVMSLTAFMGIGATTAFAAVGEKADVYLVDYPRSGDTNNNGEWGHGNLNYMNGWKGLSTKYTGLRAMGSYSGNIAYCIEPGTSQRTGDTLTEKDENFFNNISPNGTISGDDIRLLIGRILQYGYRGGISTSWKSQNESDANCIAHAYATQILIWETIVGERDAGFNHVSTGGCNAVLECVSSAHPLRSKILSYYNSMVTSVQNHTKVPSFCTRSSGSAKVNQLEWNGSKYVATLTDTNGVLGNYNFSANIDGVSFSTSGNKLTVSMDTAPSKEFTITATKKNGVRRGVVVWSDGIHQNGNGIQDVVTYAQEVSDPVSGFVKMKVSYGSCQIVKTSEDGKVDGIQFTVSGNGVNQTVTTANGGKFQPDNLMPGVYTVTEQSIDKYVPQEVHRVTVVAGQVAKVNFNNVLKRGNLQVIKSSEDNLVEGVTFHLYGTSLAGIEVDEYAVTDKNGVASFDDVLISGTTPYTVEEVDTAIRYVVPANQTAPINWKEVTTRNFTNILKKFSVTVTKSDREEGTPQGDATLAGAVYGIYKGETLVDKYVTDKNGQFTTKEYICDDDWTIREITPSEGYLLDTTIHKEQLATLLPDIAAEWSDRNYPLLPTQVTVFANRKAWWKCKDCGREWNTLISTRSGGSKCPYCSGYIFLKGQIKMRLIYAEYNMYHNSIDVTTFDGYILRIDCNVAEDGLRTTPGSQCALNALAIDEPLEYATLALDGNLQMWVDAEDSLELL